jgi:ankyrin repeat protein
MKYWRDDKFDVFEPNKLYKAFYDYEYEVEYSEFAFFLRRGNIEKVKELTKKLKINSKTKIKPNGDTALHICAEFGNEFLFNFFFSKTKTDVSIRNDAGETPFIVACREGRLKMLKFMVD